MYLSQIKNNASAPTLSTTPEASAHEALLFMKKYGIHHLLVANGDEIPKVVDDRLLLNALASKEPGDTPKIQDITPIEPAVVSPDAEVGEVLGKMRAKGDGVVLVKGDDKRYGIITEQDFLHFLHSFLCEQDENHPFLRTELSFSHPVLQNIMKTMADIGL